MRRKDLSPLDLGSMTEIGSEFWELECRKEVEDGWTRIMPSEWEAGERRDRNR